ncbi:WD domain containing protein [Ophiocordyceps camponoti-floridani]|uniref:WD domain containing protein n=1 Tax=Ophiocordyceps camponoti-floridani TaxID=2030778 RepID=A0A8H4Q4Z3_9HYPO|nr:WD domain containing protein [Ophiocordyceps camponoti-floridani]
MASSTTNQRLKLTPSSSPFPPRAAKTPLRGRTPHEFKLCLKRVFGTTCRSPTGFDSAKSLFAYTAGGAVVVVDVCGTDCSQRFYRARPSAVPLHQGLVSSSPTTTTPIKTATPKANDSRNRVAPALRDLDAPDSPAARTWTKRERIKAATCLALSRDARFLAVGETGYAPRVLIFGLTDASSDTPLVSISEHSFGVAAVAWSADSRYLASLGAANDGFLYIWKIDPRTGAAKLFQQNKCTSYVRSMVWRGHSLVTLGVRHVKVWKIDDGAPHVPAQKPLSGRNVVLGDLLETTFSCAAVDGDRLIMCTETGDVCILDDDERQTKLVKVMGLDFPVTAINIHRDVAYVAGRDGQFATLDVPAVFRGNSSCALIVSRTPAGIVALGCLDDDSLVTVDARQSIDLWAAHQTPGHEVDAVVRMPMPGHGESVAGVQALVRRPNTPAAAFVTWSYSGTFAFWDLEGRVKSTALVAVDAVEPDGHIEFVNQLTCARTTSDGQLLVTADRLGILKVTEASSGKCLLDIKAHSSDCLSICIFDDDDKFIMACCGRDRTAQLFHRRANGTIEHFQTLEFAAKVVQVLVPSDDRVITCSLDRTIQVHDLVSKDGDPDVMAALPSRVISLRASPTSMVMSQDGRSIFVSLLDRSVFQFDLATGRQLCCFKCTDEGGVESTVLDSLSVGSWTSHEAEFLLGSSNTDKSVRIYDAHSGSFLDREWGHTESINGACLVEDDDGSKKVVSVGSDGTMMVWSLDFNEVPPRSSSRDPSPTKDSGTNRPTLRRVLSKAELAEFQRPVGGRQSPPRALQHRSSRLGLATSAASISSRVSASASQTSPCIGGSSMGADIPPRRRPSSSNQLDSPPPSPKTRNCRTQSLSMTGKAVRKKSSSSLHGFGSANMATEQACRTLRAYRKKLSSAEPITADGLSDLDHELRLTIAALGDRAIRTQAINETVLSGLLDQYSERLVTLLDEKLRRTTGGGDSKGREDEGLNDDGRRSSTGSTVSSSST